MRTALAIIFIVLLGTVMYGLTLRGIPGNPTVQNIRDMEHSGSPFESSHERSPYAQLLALVNDGKIDLNMALADMGAPDVGYSNGKFYSYFPIGTSLLILPLYLLGEYLGYAQIYSYATIALLSIVSLVLIFLISKNIFGLKLWSALLAVLIYGFATTSWSYSITLYQHAITTFMLLSMFYFAWKAKNSNAHPGLWAVIAWFIYGISIFIDYPNALILSPLVLYLLLGGFSLEKITTAYKINYKISIVFASIIFLLLIVAHGVFNSYIYGGPLSLSNAFARYERDKLDLLLKRESNEDIGLGRDALELTGTFSEERMPKGLVTLLFADDKGIFFYSPILILSLIGFFLIRNRHNLETGILALVCIVNLFLYASFGDPWGGWAFGPRYLIPSMAILAIFAAYTIEHYNHKILAKISFAFLFAFSSAIALLGAITTNVVPPKIEAIPLGMPHYNYLLNYNFLLDNKSGSFVFNYIVRDQISLYGYYYIIYALIIISFLVIAFVLPKFKYAD